MSSLETATEPIPRSPSPAVPGAWPSSASNSLHRRSNTFPAASPHSLLPADSLRLDHVRRFQSRLSQTLSKTVERVDTTVSRSAEHLDLSDSISIPSDGSGLTSSTQASLVHLDTNTSLSAFADSSMTTSFSTPVKGAVTFSRYENEEDSTEPASIGSKPRICDASSDSISKIFPSTSSYDYAASSPASPTLSTENTNYDHLLRISFPASLSRSSWSSHSDPVSPIIFSSPTSSNNPLPRQRSYHRQEYCPSLEFSSSPSWDTSFNTFESLRIESGPQFIRPEQMLNPSQSQPFNTFDLYNNNDSSTELEVPTVPMLTTLSLPGSFDTTLDISRRNSPRHHHGQDNSHTQDSSLSSSPPSVSEATGTAAVIGVLEFPSPPLTLSPFITAPPPESPIIDLPIADSSTVEYASAVVSSSWGPDISIRPDYPIANILPNASSPSTSETLRDPALHQESTGRTKPSVMITRFKTLGRKMKKLLSLFPNAKVEGSISNNRPDRPEITQDGLRNTYPLTPSNDLSDPSTDASLQREDSLMEMQGNHSLPLPPGLSSCPTRRRPVVSETLTPNSASYRSQDLTSPPVIRITSSSCSYRTPMTYVPDEPINDLDLTEDSMRRLEIEARPKTLEEIKSKRRFSLSILSNTRRSVSQPSSSIVAVARTRQRPRSAIVLPAASSSSISGGAISNDTHDPGPLSSTINNTLEDEMPMELTWPSIPGTLPAQSTSLKRGDIDVNRKKHQRFSLPTLSHLTKFA